MKYASLTTAEKADLIIREEINKAKNIEMFIQECTKRVTELIQDERRYGRQD